MVQMVKTKMVEEIKQHLGSIDNVVVVQCNGLQGNDNVQLRKTLRQAGLTMRVVQNRLTRLALADSQMAALADLLAGPSAVVYGGDDPAVLAKTLSEATDKLDSVTILGGIIEGRVLEAPQVDALAKLPNREQMLAIVACTIAAPMTGLGRAMNQIIMKLGYALNAHIEKLQSA